VRSNTGYDLSIVGPAPLPPHERHWRHPSELGPTITSVDATPNGRWLAVATGAAAAVLAAVMVIAVSPPRSSAPVALTATTIASVSVRGPNEPRVDDADLADSLGIVRLNRNVSLDRTLTLTGPPNAISAAPMNQSGDHALAASMPTIDERVLLLTRSHTYELPWSDADYLRAPDGAVIVNRNGELIAVFVDGALVVVAG
jgi:hypothetical protein